MHGTMRLHCLNLLLIIFLFFTVNTKLSYGTILEWEPFRVRTDLALNIPMVEQENEKNTGSVQDESPGMRDGHLFTLDTNRKEETKWNRFNLPYLTLTFSRCAVGQLDMTRSLSNGQNKWNTIKSLPSTFLHSPYGDTFESLGKVFEPQVNLGIEF